MTAEQHTENLKNLVLIPSVVRNPLLSHFLSENQRLEQLYKSVQSVLDKIPNPYIIVIEGGSKNVNDESYLLSNGVNEVFHYDLEQNGKRLPDPNRSKSFGEMTLFIEFFSSDMFKKIRPLIKSVSKLGGRAFLNDTFVFDDSENCFVRWQPESWSGQSTCCQRYWKVPVSKIDHVIFRYIQMRNNFDYIIDIEHGFYIFNVIPLDGIKPNLNEGVTHYVSSYGEWENT